VLDLLVGVRGFEPPTSTSRKFKNEMSGGIKTSEIRIKPEFFTSLFPKKYHIIFHVVFT